jgi:diadenosine tetraphosphate (Ap4A) HIT family hydrolase
MWMFVLDDRLEKSSFFVADWNLCTVRLKNNKIWPWLYLVPKRDAMREIHDLSAADQGLLMAEIAQASKALQQIYKAHKINTAALGNMVPQLHIHVFARFENDPAWPNPIWAVPLDEVPYTEEEKNIAIQGLQARFETFCTKEGNRACQQ